MKGFVIAAALAFVLSAAPGFAQAPAGQAPPARPAAPPAQTAPVPVLPPPAPFPAGAKIGLVNLQLIAQMSVEGKAATGKVNALIQKKQAEGAQKAKDLQSNQQKLDTSGSVMSETARAALEKDIDRQTKEGERFQQDAQQEVNELQQELQDDFQRKLFPILEKMAAEKGLHALLSQGDAGVIWADPGIDLTAEAIKAFDAATAKPAAK
jgi:outer membrane protein